MPKSCVAVNCTNHNMKPARDGSTISFHRFPKDQDRRRKWIQAVKRINANKSRWSPSKHAVLCGKHFIEGKPHADPNHPDYVPSVFPHVKESEARSAKKVNRYESLKRRKVKQALFQDEPATKVQVTTPGSSENQEEGMPVTSSELQVQVMTPGSSKIQEESFPGMLSELPTSATSEQVMYMLETQNLRAERDSALDKCKLYEDKMRCLKLNAASVTGDDTKCMFYTGLNWVCFLRTFKFLENFNDGKCKMSPIDQFFITLVKLRFAIPFQFIADRIGVSESTVITIFWRWIDIIFDKLSFLIMTPDHEAIIRTLPPHFKDKFPRLTTIIDCFEIFIDQPKSKKARATTYSNYKKHTTVKFLIGCTPLGHISFLSKAWGGRASDVEIVKQSGFMDSSCHFPGDQILADRGFTVQDEIAISCGAHLILPSFTKGKKQLSAQEVETSRKIASVRIHIERIIGLIKNRYAILQGTLPIKVIKSAKDEAINEEYSNIDKIVTACAVLVNLGEGIVAGKE